MKAQARFKVSFIHEQKYYLMTLQLENVCLLGVKSHR